MRPTVFRLALVALYGLTLAAVLYLLAQGWSYYATPLSERSHHAGYWLLKPGGRVGHGLGLVGSAMMVLMLAYSIRKRASALRRLGPLSRWLDLHIYLGISGPLLVILHSSFKVQGLVALSFWSMIAVAVSGVVGRYLYLQIPRTRAGEEIALEELQRRDRALIERLQGQFGLAPEQVALLNAASGLQGARPSLARLSADMLFGAVRERRQVRRLVNAYRHAAPAALWSELEQLAHEKAATHRRILLWQRAHELFHYWHVFHKPFAVVMYLFMIVHVAVAWMTGYAGMRAW
jgi:hypothetical protein